MNVKYRNPRGRRILWIQALFTKSYFKEYYQSKVIQKKEWILSGKVKFIYYYNHYNKPHNHFFEIDSNFTNLPFAIEENEYYEGGYKLEISSRYDKENSYTGRVLSLEDKDGNTVGIEIQDENGVTEDFKNTIKYYYDKNTDSQIALFECYYDVETGEFDHLYMERWWMDPSGQSSVTIENTPDVIEKIKYHTGISQELVDYYLSPHVQPNFKKLTKN